MRLEYKIKLNLTKIGLSMVGGWMELAKIMCRMVVFGISDVYRWVWRRIRGRGTYNILAGNSEKRPLGTRRSYSKLKEMRRWLWRVNRWGFARSSSWNILHTVSYLAWSLNVYICLINQAYNTKEKNESLWRMPSSGMWRRENLKSYTVNLFVSVSLIILYGTSRLY
jgi:hypothetical protein